MKKVKRNLMLVFGTRPEAIKMAPVIIALKKSNDFRVRICVTAQHREMLDQVLSVFNLKPDYDLNLMLKDQSLNELFSRIVAHLDIVFKKEKLDLVLVHGDTTTSFAAAIASFYSGIKVAHVEAGLRTGNLKAPWPEEGNRNLTAVITDYHFAPTITAKKSLIDEGILENRILVTGNTVVDTLLSISGKIDEDKNLGLSLSKKFHFLDINKPKILITGHRRENFGEGFENICLAIEKLAEQYKEHEFIYPVHLNPNVKEPVSKILKGKNNIFLIEPLDYIPFIYLMKKASLILTDSGGIQEEAPSLGVPVLVMRDTTERPEAVAAGVATLVGTKIENIILEAKKVLEKKDYKMAKLPNNPYGDGKASQRIVQYLEETLW
ncbi:UDP-N-acetylglucosamine 2-epimerase (non-hydrolyzing) [Paracoccaceae bacterium]|nr:UDP-N-acetylglucosamine 2-epimerase (non-hydrolyzing) [Paracoccaceae bacterium]